MSTPASRRTRAVAKHVRRERQNKVIQKRLRDADDELQIVIVKDMMLTGFDAPPLHTLYLDRPLKGALLMQTLARVNRTFREKPDGLLVAYAPLVENLTGRSPSTPTPTRPTNRWASTSTRPWIDHLLIANSMSCAPVTPGGQAGPRSEGWVKAAYGLTNYLRAPSTPGNKVPEDEETLGDRFRNLSNRLARAWALCAGDQNLDHLRVTAKFYEEVRVCMGKFDAQQRQAEGKPVPDEIKRMLTALVATSTVSGEIVDIYDAAGLPKPPFPILVQTSR